MAKRNGLEFNLSEDGSFTITGKISKSPDTSKSGNSFLLASTRGNWSTGEEFNGKEIVLGVNMYAEVSELPKEKPAAAPAKKK